MIYEFLADGFEEVEALTPYDMLLRAGADIKTVSLNRGKTVTGAHGVRIEADITLDEAAKAPDAVVLPGGMPGAKNLRESETVCRIVKETAARGGVIGAICAAPFILGELGLLEGKSAICYPGFEKCLHGAKISDKRVVSDGNTVTAAGMGVALEFGAELITVIYGSEKAAEVLRSVMAQ